jgi:hypothetical protein
VKVKYQYVDWVDTWSTEILMYRHFKQMEDASTIFKIYLYPLSCLTEEIPFNGKMVVPLVELAKVEGAYCGEGKVNICSENYIRLGVDTDFWYDSSFYKVIDANIEPVNNQLKLFELLLKMKINIFPDDIESIDPRSELANPYL